MERKIFGDWQKIAIEINLLSIKINGTPRGRAIVHEGGLS